MVLIGECGHASRSATFLKTSWARQYNGTHPAMLAGVNNSGGTALEFFASSNGSSWGIAEAKSMGSLSLNEWVHFAVVRSGSTWYLFKNGQQTDTWSSGLALAAGSNNWALGIYNNGNWFQGYIDEYRISTIARWTTNFTPESGPYTE